MRNFCTLFDKNYLYRGLTLYRSLTKVCPSFTLWILCMDQESYELLRKMSLPHVKLITSQEFENDRLKAVKSGRTSTEYSWTCGANLCWHMLQKMNDGELITYIDADTYFYDDPEALFHEIGNASIAIIEHRFTGYRKRFEKYVGKYNVCWVSFRKDRDGLKACEWWKNSVLDWCFAYFKDGMIGDQHYLNDWTSRFQNVHVITHEGADVAPWNIENQPITLKNNKVYIGDYPLIFYHFHNFTILSKDKFIPITAYYLPKTALRYIYKTYTDALTNNIEEVGIIDPKFRFGFKKKHVKSLIARALFRIRLFAFLYIRYDYYKLKKTAKV